jgi:transglutaminase-like putative cysteine protease
MKHLSVCHILCALVFVAVLTAVPPLAHADQWIASTPEELAMTSQPEVPGAAAVYLFREETTEDKFHMFSTYVRLKVLTEEGKKYANVELGYASSEHGGSITVDEIQGRTIHPDGTIIPFTGKPYDKLIEKSRGAKHMAKVFTLPDVEVGSIIEYRYKRRLDDNYFMAPQWYVQSDLYTRKAHYMWKPTNATLITNDGRGRLTNSISWTPILPEGAEFKNTRLPPQNGDEGQLIFDLNVRNVPPVPDEDFMPPITSLSYRVLFYYSPYLSKDEFWKDEGKYWAKNHDKFIGPGSGIRAAVQSLTAPSDTQEQKLHKIYDAVMQLENTDFTREHTTAEEKAAGLKQVRTADDVWSHKRGSSDQLSDLFVAMARAAGMKAYVMVVTNRDHNVFLPSYLSLSQLDDDIAIVNVDGKEQFFDPGSRFCTYGHLAWKHTAAAGLREVDGGTALFNTPPDSYTASRIQRVADLTMDEHGIATGTVTMVYSGAPALSWRQRSLTGDNTSLEHDLRTNMEKLLPSGMEVKLASVSNPDNYREPLRVSFTVKGAIGSSTGKRLIIPGDIFEANSKPAFPHEKRDIAVYFDYPSLEQDAVRVKFPASMTVESAPSNGKIPFQHYAAYDMSIASTPTSITVHRDYALGEFVFLPKDYTELRSFYSKMDAKNQESIILTASPVSAAKSGAAN